MKLKHPEMKAGYSEIHFLSYYQDGAEWLGWGKDKGEAMARILSFANGKLNEKKDRVALIDCSKGNACRLTTILVYGGSDLIDQSMADTL